MRRPRAFTLIELMLVILILGFLAALVVPQFRNASDDASASQIHANLRQVRTQVELYRTKTNGLFPDSIQRLVDEDYLHAAPEHPGEPDFQYDPTTGVYWSPLHPEW